MTETEIACEQRQELAHNYQRAVFDYAKAVARLREFAGAIPKVDLALLYQITENARLFCQREHEELMKHLIKHGCS